MLDTLVAGVPTLITLIRHPVNRGKGSAVLTGARYAVQAGYTHVPQIDADGQHRVSDIPRFLEQAAAHPQALIVGCSEYGATVPLLDGLEIINVDTPVSYPSDGVSHFRIVLDNYLISRMHATLFFGMLLRLPFLIARHWRTR